MTLPPEKEKKIIQFMSKQTQAQTQAKKLTYAQQAEAYGDNLFGILFKAKYGQTPEVFVEVAQQQIDKAQQQIDKAQQQLDMARQLADKAQQQADRLQEKERKIIVYMYKTVRLSAQEIAKELEVDLTYVESVLANLPPENN
jgi:DNA-directed RNA polymerase specialized sigma24 family protein